MGQTVRFPANEAQRLLAVRSLNAIDRASATPELGALAELAQGVLQTPYAAIHIVDEDWLRIAGQAGIPVTGCPRELSICTRVVFANAIIEIEDLEADHDLRAMPYVSGPPHFRSYAGAPVELESGLVIGAFCVLDTVARALSEGERQCLKRFAVVAGGLLRLHKANLLMRLAESGLRTAAMTDPLTGFFNRSALDTIVDGALEASLAAGQSFGVLYVDMDGFKSINDKLGHHAGDEVLREAANRIRSVIRSGDIAVRMGGDEFAIFVPHPPNVAALASVAERLLAAFREPFEIDGQSILARLSVGVAIAPKDGARRIDLLRNVDAALYEAKGAGRDRFMIAGAIV